MDGSGYPDGLRRFQIPNTVRILQIVDIYDALKTKRPYKAAMSQDDALKVIETEVEKGWWDAKTFFEFKNLLQKKATSLLPMAVTPEYGMSELRTPIASNV